MGLLGHPAPCDLVLYNDDKIVAVGDDTVKNLLTIRGSIAAPICAASGASQTLIPGIASPSGNTDSMLRTR